MRDPSKRLASPIVACLLAALLLAPGAWAQSIVRPPGSVSAGRADTGWYIDPRSVDVATERDGTTLLVWSEWQIGGSDLVVTLAPYRPTTFALLPPATRTEIETIYARPRAAAGVDGGDGVLQPICERCDDGAGNSDLAADACRTSCRLPRCGDGVVDGGEDCDDGDRGDCDGCSYGCLVETGLGCGDGIAFPSCGETCDDGNAIVGDGCAPGCTLERVPGGGAPSTDCWVAWSVDNAANVPLLDNAGRFNAVQVCTDDDPRCDHDGGTPGSCTFSLTVCVNNTGLATTCEPPSRLASWELVGPSAGQAAHHPAAAAVRAAFAAVPGAVVGPTTRDLCSPPVLVPVALRSNGKAGKLKLKSRGQLYGKGRDTDALRLVCLPQ